MITDSQWNLFFAAFSDRGTIKSACQASGIGRSTVYDRKAAGEAPNASPEAKAWLARFLEANDDAGDTCEDEMHRRGIEGVEEPVFGRVAKDQDGEIGRIRKYSDACLLALAKARKPERFKDRVANEHSGPGGKPIQTENKVIAIPAIEETSPE